ncbi:MAG TPA: hypothetical protein VGU22_08130 [Methylomirabilota bacterium]|jgi:hypothetical protein|nr:hypothetical protein [Methylomirabilota bacterium]
MSSKNNVNPDHYKTAGRDRQGEDLAPGPRVERSRRKKGNAAPSLIPGAAPDGKRPEPEGDESERD